MQNNTTDENTTGITNKSANKSANESANESAHTELTGHANAGQSGETGQPGSGASPSSHTDDAPAHDVAVKADASEFPFNPGAGMGFASNAGDHADEPRAADLLSFEDDGEPLTELELEEHSRHAAEDRSDAEEAAAAYARASMRDFDVPVESAITEGDEPVDAHRGEKPRQLVIVNDVQGDETRIAILEQGKLAQFYSERAATSTNVGSIYKARVVNVEPAIQAAFVDFGEGANGFLHISDLHPKYFPGDSDKTEKVGRKIPRRSRPMMQEALRRGQEIVVQVLKEGLGSKGPTVTSYLSIPGRLLVMMPDMDNVGVSRKVDDEDSRRQMRKILDSLNLPEGFGFILRTAGFDSTRTELARDAQYLTRLWQVMDKRMHAVGAPCSLYTEGDILLRTIRDCIDSTVDGIVVDSESAFHRAKAFLDVVSPKTSARVHFYDRRMPIFHAFDVERQVDLIHSREVPLPSGGALVLDQTEALVAIDVNSGRSRSARDSETNAYQTNQEAVDEIARQIRLRDLGGVIVSDLIDMRMSKHRRDIEDRLKQNLSKDRAKSTVTEISEFGIVEMTRQRMRPSLRKTHYMDCPHCSGHGEIRMPDTVASDAMRRIQLVLDMEKVARVEVVCSSKVAAVLLSRKRRAMGDLEDLFGKKIEVRISEAIAVDRVDLYAYDDRNADVDLDRPLRIPTPSLASLPTDLEDEEPARGQGTEGAPDGLGGGGRRRRRRRRKPAAADATSIILSGGFDDLPDIDEDEESVSETLARNAAEQAAADERDSESAPEDGQSSQTRGEGHADGERGGRRGRRGRRRGRGSREQDGASATEGQEPSHAPRTQHAPRQQQGHAQQPRAAKPIAPPPPPREPSEPIRVHALAKEIELTSKEVLAKCAELGIEVKGHQSLLAGEQGDAIRKAYGKPPFDVPEVVADASAESDEFETGTDAAAEGEGGRRKRRRRRGRGRGRGGDAEGGGFASGEGADAAASSDVDGAQRDGETEESSTESSDDSQGDEGDSSSAQDGGTEGGTGGGEGGERKRRRRRGRGGRGRTREGRDDRGEPNAGGENATSESAPPTAIPAPKTSERDAKDSQQRGGGRGERRPDNRGGERPDNRGGERSGARSGERSDNRGGERPDNRGGERGGERGGRNRRGGRGRNSNGGGERGGERSGGDRSNDRGGERRAESAPPPPPPPPPAAAAPVKPPKPRSLYGGRVRKLGPGEMPKGGGDE